MAQDHTSRKSPRRSLKERAGILIAGKYHYVETDQVGEGGLGFFSELVIDQQTELIFHFFIPSGGLVVVKSQVLYCKKEGARFYYGCRFVNLEIAPKRWIRNFVAAKTEKEAAFEMDKLKAA